MSASQTVDPSVSRAKFDREVGNYRTLESEYRRKGWLMLDAAFPQVLVAFAATRLRPVAIVTAVLLDFTDYDLRPPSVRFVDPFTREPVKSKDLGFRMFRRQAGATAPNAFAMVPGVGLVPHVPGQELIQTNGPEEEPFLCLPGIREYHDNPAHSGDQWLLHRNSGEGCLAFILEKIWSYGVNPITEFQAQLLIQVSGLQPPQPLAYPE